MRPGRPGRPPTRPAEAAAGPAPRGKALPRKRAGKDEGEAAAVARMSGEGIGPGYLVAGKYWVAKEFGRVIKVASKTIRDLRVAEVVEQDVHIDAGGQLTFRTKLRVSFKYEDK